MRAIPLRELLHIKIRKMVLLGRIELPASPLPRECSTTELQQHIAGGLWDKAINRKRPYGGGRGACQGRPCANAAKKQKKPYERPENIRCHRARQSRTKGKTRRTIAREPAPPQSPIARNGRKRRVSCIGLQKRAKPQAAAPPQLYALPSQSLPSRSLLVMPDLIGHPSPELEISKVANGITFIHPSLRAPKERGNPKRTHPHAGLLR